MTRLEIIRELHEINALLQARQPDEADRRLRDLERSCTPMQRANITILQRAAEE